ncbi:Hypothetical predicted protein [Pelobates cultripes]|uniref:Uncharacterized protein n=1 Tax=Pelobates cultripes TaxID=61616 RepID=A0AAD1WQ15_PELCU|nr:Hypothetical predicted protein [Pelobates cultripes]
MSHRSAKRPAKADKTLFFMAKAAHGKQGREEIQDGGGHGSREVSPSPPSSPTSLLEDSPLTLATMKSFMADFTMQIQSTIEGQLKSLAGPGPKHITYRECSQQTCLRAQQHG